MEQEELRNLAEEAGFSTRNGEIQSPYVGGSDIGHLVEALVKLAMAAEREACAQVAGVVSATCLHPDEIAEAIRARSKTGTDGYGTATAG